ncbi:MAG: hypothetical protein RL266_1760 [Bacteroidota bacterium]|jgi:hypothetical protein
MHVIEPNQIPKEIQWAETLVSWMDDRFKIPFINFRFGLDPIIGLIPWAGDVVAFLISALIVKGLVDAGLPRPLLRKMIWNILLDMAVGAIPVVGDVWDFFNRSNRKNLRLAKDYFESRVQSGK